MGIGGKHKVRVVVTCLNKGVGPAVRTSPRKSLQLAFKSFEEEASLDRGGWGGASAKPLVCGENSPEYGLKVMATTADSCKARW